MRQAQFLVMLLLSSYNRWSMARKKMERKRYVVKGKTEQTRDNGRGIRWHWRNYT